MKKRMERLLLVLSAIATLMLLYHLISSLPQFASY
jgi:hypothetical protein